MVLSRPRVLDAFCGGGGVSVGLHRAGFDVVGVDKEPQPDYPFEFHRGDAVEFVYEHGHEFDLRVGSPPCQFATAYRRKGHGVGATAVNLIPQTREAMLAVGGPYMIENVEQARAHLVDPVRVCGSAFGLDVQRHRLFESNVAIVGTACDHSVWTPRFPPATNRTNPRKTVEVGVWRIPFDVQCRAMGIDWITDLPHLSQAIPPAYAEHLGAQLLVHLSGAVAA